METEDRSIIFSWLTYVKSLLWVLRRQNLLHCWECCRSHSPLGGWSCFFYSSWW